MSCLLFYFVWQKADIINNVNLQQLMDKAGEMALRNVGGKRPSSDLQTDKINNK